MPKKDCCIQDIGEFALIERLVEVLGPSGQGAGQGVIRGIGDDAAVLQNMPGTRLLAACDLLIEGVHFDLSFCTPRQLGWKALAVNLSDIAAMGGRPRWALVSLGVRPELKVSFVEEVYAGIAALAEKFGVIIVGGDTCSSPERLVVDLCVLGEVNRAAVAYRSGAREGDYLLVTGKLGAAAAGLAYLSQRERPGLEGAAELLEAHLQPVPRVKEALVLTASGLVGAMNDLSDGLASELHEIAAASGCGACIRAERLPVSAATVALARQLGVDPLNWALYGGEDYELLLTVRGGKGAPLKIRGLIRTLQKATGTTLTLVGRSSPLRTGCSWLARAGKRNLYCQRVTATFAKIQPIPAAFVDFCSRISRPKEGARLFKGRFVLITGFSGAGKSGALRSFEDLGFFSMDNLPPALIPKFAELFTQSGGKINRVALVCDIRGGELFQGLSEALDRLEEMGFNYEILFLEAAKDVLIRRYKETRRRHPLAERGSMVSAIREEGSLLEDIKGKADVIINTTDLAVADLQAKINRLYAPEQWEKNILITVNSFGYKYGIPLDADLVFDVRFLPNPYYVDSLRNLDGNHREVHAYIWKWVITHRFFQKLKDMLEFLVPCYIKEGKPQLVIAIGCTGGKHRSVSLANEMARLLAERGYEAKVEHRDIRKA